MQERREAVLLKQNEEMRDIYESEKRLWAKMQEENQARVHKLDAALEEISGQKHDLFLQLKEAKGHYRLNIVSLPQVLIIIFENCFRS